MVFAYLSTLDNAGPQRLPERSDDANPFASPTAVPQHLALRHSFWLAFVVMFSVLVLLSIGPSIESGSNRGLAGGYSFTRTSYGIPEVFVKIEGTTTATLYLTAGGQSFDAAIMTQPLRPPV